MRSTRARSVLSVLMLLAVAVTAGACGTDEPLPSRTPVAASVDDSAPPGAAPGLPDFEARLRDATTREGALVRELPGAISPAEGGPAARRTVVAHMRAWADGEHGWLQEHPAEPCYDAAATKLEGAIVAMTSAATWLESMSTVSIAPSDDVTMSSMGTEASNDLQDVARNLTDAAALAKAARATCT